MRGLAIDPDEKSSLGIAIGDALSDWAPSSASGWM